MVFITLQNFLLPKINTRLKIRFTYYDTINNIDTICQYETKFLTINPGNYAIPTDIPKILKSFICIDIYLLYESDAYNYNFKMISNQINNTVTIKCGTYKPIIRINNVKASSVNQVARNGCYQLFCCNSIEENLDNFKQLDNDCCIIL